MDDATNAAGTSGPTAPYVDPAASATANGPQNAQADVTTPAANPVLGTAGAPANAAGTPADQLDLDDALFGALAHQRDVDKQLIDAVAALDAMGVEYKALNDALGTLVLAHQAAVRGVKDAYEAWDAAEENYSPGAPLPAKSA